MVNKNVIKKLSDRDLEKYIQSDSRSVADAVQYAYDILQERGRYFSPAESEQIEQLIHQKRESEFADENSSLDEGITSDENAIELYKNSTILYFTLLFGIIFGAVLQMLNFVKIKDIKGAIITILFAIGFSFLQIVILDYIGGSFIGNLTIRTFIAGIGAVGLSTIRLLMFPKDLAYRAKSASLAAVLSIVIIVVILIGYTQFS